MNIKGNKGKACKRIVQSILHAKENHKGIRLEQQVMDHYYILLSWSSSIKRKTKNN